MTSKFYDRIRTRKTEGEIQEDFNKELEKHFGVQVYRDNNCDGLLIKDNLKMLIEYKYDELMKNSIARAKVLIQVIFYLKEFEKKGEILPNVIFIGDINEVFVLQADCLLKYLKKEEIDWNYTHSNAWQKYPYFVKEISEDIEINPYIFDINDCFDFKDVVKEIEKQCKATQYLVNITEQNIDRIFADFEKNIINDSQATSYERVSAFIGCIINRNEFYQHPNNNNLLITPSKNISIKGNAFKAFFSHFQNIYSPQEKEIFTAIADRLILDAKRRMSGEYFTPTIFAKYANTMLDTALGKNWKEDYLVWDCCWGTGNLTRDYKYSDLYVSTLLQEELDCGALYNQEAVAKFQFDFLNDEINNLFSCKFPKSLFKSLQNKKPIVFFINPPYGTSCNGGANSEHKKDCANTKTNKEMKAENYGECTQNMYSQFLYKIIKIKEQFNLNSIYIGLFSPTLFLTGNSWSKFRKKFLSTFQFVKAIQFRGGHFPNVTDDWGIGFTIWKSGETSNKNYFKYTLVDNINETITEIGEKTVYNLDGKQGANAWAREPIKHLKSFDSPQISSAVKIKQMGRGKLIKNAIGYFASNSNNIDMNATYVSIFSGTSSRANGYSINEENYSRCITLFAARKLITKNWINSKDEYMIPNINHHNWVGFLDDCVIFSLFNNASQQSSLRNIEYKDKKYDIENQFFFMSKEKIQELANKNNFTYTYNDAKVSENRFVYKKLQNLKLSQEAQSVLNKAIELTEKSFEYRDMFNQEHPEYQIMNWDCGWYQIKQLLSIYFKDDLKEFNALYKILSDKMRPMVYELGFLKD